MQNTLIHCVTGAGKILLQHFGKIRQGQRKESQSSVVTAADLASERWILQELQKHFPQHNTVAEETGCVQRGSDFTWIIDPLDGTSNFVAGIPWFGVLLALLQNGQPILAASFQPVGDLLYLAAKGDGVQRNGEPVHVTPETDLSNILCAYGFDCAPNSEQTRYQATSLARVANHVRNVRATNSLVDFLYTLDGHFGAFVNHATKIWDIAPACLMFKEAGGLLTDFQGREIELSLGPDCLDRTYAVVGASHALLPQLIKVISTAE